MITKNTWLKILAFAQETIEAQEEATQVVAEAAEVEEVQEEKPAKRGRKAKPVEEKLEAAEEPEGDATDLFASDDEESEPEVSIDDLRKVLTKIVKTKGDKGKEQASKIIMTITKKKTPAVNDIPAAMLPKAYEQLQKLL